MSAEPLSLADLQARLFTLITARGKVTDELQRIGEEPRFVTDHVRGDAKLGAVERLDIYNGMYYFRLLEDVLQVDYPTVRAVLGPQRFANMVSEYLETYPPNHPSARYASERLPAFVTSWAERGQAPAYLPDLAALEWARVDVFDDADDQPLTVEALRATPPEALVTLPLRAVRASRLVMSAHDLAPLWRAAQAEAPLPLPAPHPCTFVVWREDGHVFHRVADDDEATFLPSLWRGSSFGALCEGLGEHKPPEEAAAAAVRLLLRWAEDLLLAAPSAPSL